MSNGLLTIIQRDALTELRKLPDESVQCCVTSPPFWGLRDYGCDGQLGLEKTPQEYVEKLVSIFREVRRVLRKDGTCWINLGDTFNSPNTHSGKADKIDWRIQRVLDAKANWGGTTKTLKPKDLCMIPARVAIALQADGWWLRSDIIWAKPNPMPERVTDRPTKAHEYLFLLTKASSYFYDAEAIKEQSSESYRNDGRWESGPTEENEKEGYELAGARNPKRVHAVFNGERKLTVNKRDVWTIATQPYPEAHFATFPEEIPKLCILAGTSAKGCCAKCGAPWERIVEREVHVTGAGRNHIAGGDKTIGVGWEGVPRATLTTETLGWQPTCKCNLKAGTTDASPSQIIPCTVLDPFAGSGTTGMVALELGRKAILIDLKYQDLQRQRCNVTLGLALA